MGELGRTENNDGARCQSCGWESDRPKPEGLRKHVLGCADVDEEDKQSVRRLMEEKSQQAAARLQKRRASGVEVPESEEASRIDGSSQLPVLSQSSSVGVASATPKAKKQRKSKASRCLVRSILFASD